jgi:hypothetical protein
MKPPDDKDLHSIDGMSIIKLLQGKRSPIGANTEALIDQVQKNGTWLWSELSAVDKEHLFDTTGFSNPIYNPMILRALKAKLQSTMVNKAKMLANKGIAVRKPNEPGYAVVEDPEDEENIIFQRILLEVETHAHNFSEDQKKQILEALYTVDSIEGMFLNASYPLKSDKRARFRSFRGRRSRCNRRASPRKASNAPIASTNMMKSQSGSRMMKKRVSELMNFQALVKALQQTTLTNQTVSSTSKAETLLTLQSL